MGFMDKVIKVTTFVLGVDLLIKPMVNLSFDNYLTGHAVANLAVAHDPVISLMEALVFVVGLAYIFINGLKY